jgi:hypothetical protein
VKIPTEARDGLSRVWLEILREKHPNVSWVLTPATGAKMELEPNTPQASEELLVAA